MTPEEAYATHGAVFLAKVTGKWDALSLAPSALRPSLEGTSVAADHGYDLRVLRSWKGVTSAEIFVRSPREEGRVLIPGATYLVYANLRDGVPSVTSCSIRVYVFEYGADRYLRSLPPHEAFDPTYRGRMPPQTLASLLGSVALAVVVVVGWALRAARLRGGGSGRRAHAR